MAEPTLQDIRAKVEAGQRLSAADGEFLFSPEVDLQAVGELADLVRRRKHGDCAYYNFNLHLNPSNLCIFRCALCAYSRDEDDPRAYTMSGDELLGRAREAVDAGCTELHVVSGVHPRKTFDWYLGMTRDLHAAFPRVHLKAWTAVEIDHFARSSKRSVRSILEALIAAGLGSLPGGGAEIFDPQVRIEICPRKADARTWLEIHRTAHELGCARTPRCSTATSRASNTASNIWSSCGTCRTPPAAFKPLCRWPFIRKTRPSRTCAALRRWTTCGWWPSAG